MFGSRHQIRLVSFCNSQTHSFDRSTSFRLRAQGKVRRLSVFSASTETSVHMLVHLLQRSESACDFRCCDLGKRAQVNL